MPEATVRSENDLPLVFQAIKKHNKYPLLLRWGPPKRSSAQNRYLWGVVYRCLADAAAEATGELVTPEDCHEFCKRQFLEPRNVPGFEIPIPGSTTELMRSGNEHSFNDYILQIQEFASRAYGAYIPDPGQYGL